MDVSWYYIFRLVIELAALPVIGRAALLKRNKYVLFIASPLAYLEQICYLCSVQLNKVLLHHEIFRVLQID